MGNACGADTTDKNQQLEDSEGGTPRLYTKPDRLPALSQAVKNQCRRINNERLPSHEANSNQQNDNQNGVLRIQAAPFKQQETQIKLPYTQPQPVAAPNDNIGRPQTMNNPFYQASNSISNSHVDKQIKSYQEEMKESNVPLTLYDRIGGQEKIKIFVDNLYKKIHENNDLAAMFSNVQDQELLKEKFRLYFTHLTGGQQYWVGKSMSQAHAGMYINDDQFDQFIHCCVSAIRSIPYKDTKTALTCLKDLTGLLQSLRAQIVQKQEEKILTFFEKLGGQDGIKQIVDKYFMKVTREKELNQFVKQTTNIELMKKKYTQFLISMTGGPIEWCGKSMAEAHQGRGIGEEEFKRAAKFFEQVLIDMNIDEDIIEQFLSMISGLKPEIVDEDEIKTIFTQTYKNEKMMQEFIERLINDDITSNFYANYSNSSTMVKGYMNYFAFLVGISQSYDGPSLKEIHQRFNITNDAFTRSSQLFNDVLKRHKLQPQTIDKAMKLYMDNAPDICCPVRQADEIQVVVEEQVEEEEDEEQKVEEIQEEAIQIPEHKQYQEQPNIETQRIEQLLDENLESELIQFQEVSNQKASRQFLSPLKNKQPKNYKYFLSELISSYQSQIQDNDTAVENNQNQILLQGELSRYMDKQKTQLQRWLILNNKALLIYKDQVNAKSFPLKPLYAIPIQEIKSVSKEEKLLNPYQRKNQAMHYLNIELNETYGSIAGSIAQLFTGQTIHVQDLQNRQHSPQRGGQKSSKTQQKHDYEDQCLIFVSLNKKFIAEWTKVLKSVMIPQINKDLNIEIGDSLLIKKEEVEEQKINIDDEQEQLKLKPQVSEEENLTIPLNLIEESLQ